MNKFTLVVFLTLLACQSIHSQQILLSNINSLWSFCGFTITPNWSIADLTTSSTTNIFVQLPTGILVKLLSSNSRLGLQALRTSSSSISNGPSTFLMQIQSRSSQMNNLNALMSQQTINLASNSGTNLAYLLLKIQGAMVGQNVPGNPDVVPGVDPEYPGDQNLSNIGLQAQAIIQLSITLSGEITNYCQQFADLAKSANNNYSSCPTIEQCLELSQKWNNTSILISSSSNSTLSNTTLVRSLNVTVQNTLIDAINSTNVFILNLRDCAKCINTGCTKNQVQTFRSCSRRKNNGSMSSSERREYCRKKASSSARRHSRNISKIRKMRKRRSIRNKRNIGSKNRNHWKNVWTRTREMARNFNSKALSLKLPSSIVQNQMILFGSSFDTFITITGNLTDLISQNATDSINNATALATAQVVNATQDFLNVVRNFAEKVAGDNIESCLSYAQEAGNLQYELMAALDNCTSGFDQVNQQMYINISVTFTGWVQTINSLSYCHDKCVSKYCPFVPFGSNLGICWTLKRLLPRIFEKQSYVDAYGECQSKCSTQVQAFNLNITAIAQSQMDANANATQEAISNIETCVNSTLIAYYTKLMQIMMAYDQCASNAVTTQAPSGTTDSTPPCGTFVRYDPVNAPNDPVTYGFAGGVDIYNSTAYVGYGDVLCSNQAIRPGYVLASPPPPKSSGAYVSCNSEELFTNTSAFYLLNHPDLYYAPTNITNLRFVKGMVTLNSTQWVYGFGRFFVNGGYALGRTRRLDTNTTNSTMFYFTPTGELQTSQFEVLICRLKLSTTVSTTTPIGSETTTEMTTSPIQPCGTFVRYDPVNAPNDPVTKGFAGGYDLQNLTAFVANGNVSCNGQAPLPGHIVVNPPAPKKSGVYITCNNGEQFSETTGSYLLNHPDLMYVAVNSTNVWSLRSELVYVNTSSYTFAYGRYLYNGRYVLGKVRNLDANTVVMFYNPGTGEAQTKDFEVLICRPGSGSTTIKPSTSDSTTTLISSSSDSGSTSTGSETITESSTSSSTLSTTFLPRSTSNFLSSGSTLAPCGTFAKYDPVNAPNDPATKGYLGAEVLGIKYYVGYGDASCGTSMPGYIYGTPPLLRKRGVYSSCPIFESFDDKNAYYLLDHPNLTYVSANSTSLWNVPNTLTVNSTDYVFFFGRYGNNLGKIRNANKNGPPTVMFYFSIIELTSLQFEVLTCKP